MSRDDTPPAPAPSGAITVDTVIRLIVEQATDGIIVQDAATGRVADVNLRAQEMYGYSRAEFLALPPGWDVRSPGERADGESLFDTAGKGQAVRQGRWHQRRDGTPFPVEVAASRVEVDGSTFLIASVRDITARLSEEDRLQQRLDDTAELLDLAAELARAVTVDDVLDRAGEGAVRAVGAVGGAMTVREEGAARLLRQFRDGAWRTFDPPIDMAGTVAAFALQAGEPVVVDDVPNDPHASALHARLFGLRSVMCVPVPEGEQPPAVVLTVHDRVDGGTFTPRDLALLEAAGRHTSMALIRARAQADVSRREAYFRALMEQSQDAVFVLDAADGRLLDTNARALKLCRRSLHEMMADTPFDPRPSEERTLAPLLHTLVRDGDVPRAQRRLLRGDGSVIPVEVSATLVDSPRGPVVLMTGRDISDRVHAEQERERLHAEAVRRAREMEVLLKATAALNRADTEEAVLTEVAERAIELCDAEIGQSGVYQDGRLAFTRRLRGIRWEKVSYELPPNSIVGHVFTTGRAYRSNDLAHDPLSDHATDERLGLRTQLTLPIAASDGTILGVLSLYNRRGNVPFSALDEVLAGALVTQGAVALERARSRGQLARTVDDLQRAQIDLTEARGAAERRSYELAAMVDIGAVVATGGDADDRFDSLVRRAAQATDFDLVLLTTYDAATDTVTARSYAAGHGPVPSEVVGRMGVTARGSDLPIYRELTRGTASLVLRPGLSGPVQDDAGLYGITFPLAIVAPLRHEGVLLGDLRFISFTDRAPSPDELRLIDALAGQVAMAVQGTLAVARMKGMREDAVFRLAAACEARDPETGAHLRNIRGLTSQLAAELGMSPDQVAELGLAGVLHDVGKIVVPDAILWKPGPLGPEEFMIVRMHATQGEAMLEGSDFYVTARAIARHHHERWDGGGYPDHRAGLEIPHAARVVAVADVYDALISPRVYKHAWEPDEAAREILSLAGTHFDPRVVEAFEAIYRGNALPVYQPPTPLGER